MSATSGIGVSQDLSTRFLAAVDSKDTRFIKVSIDNELLVHDLSVPVQGTLSEDLAKLQDSEIIRDDVPAYILVRLDEPPTQWLVIDFVPEGTNVRYKMLYAASRRSLTRSLGSSVFTDSIFVTSKEDLTEAYAAHRRHVTAPQPLSTREQEIADARAAEREAGAHSYRPKVNPIGHGVGLNWSDEVEDAIKALGHGEGSGLVLMNIDIPTETLTLVSSTSASVKDLSSALPTSEPGYAFFAWSHSHSSSPRRDIIFIYSCPSTSPIKHRMLYSTSAYPIYMVAKTLLPPDVVAARRIETSDPKEITEDYLKIELKLTSDNSASNASELPDSGEKKPFAKPKGPNRRR
ncbi:actin depolymerizing protein [Guyanagaster necrorhizus]|uniref:Actin depolymerizing protein n=1 Tax=Guyanagaster necrorhizus TaxID=856835 RepID=A0A9P8B0D8_9AGAR|nr:actin depolymerizing protein [Guyanagaster necrorhizus MCA 3950]KAG7452977.1 actin depolymerizing protein [Guyanagaster necrorhizus MCA 3950]